MVHILYNPKSNCGKDMEKKLDNIKKYYQGQEYIAESIVDIKNLKSYFEQLEEDEVVLVGGDGTINVLCNSLRGYEIKNNIYLHKAGTGNDFLNDISKVKGKNIERVLLNNYIENLPVVIVNGKEYLFINNVGYGIDGKVCTAGEELREQGKTKINYTTLAIKLLLTDYKSNNAKISVDGECYEFNRVWMAPVMNGRFYGGGMMPCPTQDRNSDRVSCCVVHDTNALQTLVIFPSLFKGEHIKYKSKITVLSGKEIKVEYDMPQDVQIDGETIKDVTEIYVRKYSSYIERDKNRNTATV